MKLKSKVLRKQKNIANGNSYPAENNPFEEKYGVVNDPVVHADINGHVVKEKRGKKKKTKKIKVKSLEGKRERAVSEAVSNFVPEQQTASNNSCFSETSTVHANTENPFINVEVTQPVTCKASSNIPVIQIHDYSHSKPKKLNPQKKPSQGDIKALRNRKPQYAVPNPFENEDLCEEAEENPIPPVRKPEVSSEKQNRSQSRLHRTSSLIISSKERKHKKRLKLIKKLRQKRKEKKESKTSVEPDGLAYNPKARRPEKRLDHLEKEIEEVKSIVTNSVASGLEKRNSNLSDLRDSTDRLEAFSKQFAVTARDNYLKQKSKATCCGFFSKHRICWYICSCKRGIKSKPKHKSPNGHSPDSIRNSRVFADDGEDNDDAYGADSKLLNPSPKSLQLRTKKISTGSNQSVHRTSQTSLLTSVQKARFLKNFERKHLLSADDARVTKKNETFQIGRKCSSVSALNDIIGKTPNLDKEARRSIQFELSKYEDGETRKRAAELLMLDYS